MDEIINIINGRITTETGDIECTKKINGLAEPVLLLDNQQQSFPAIVSADGECDANLFDDKFKIGIYHKMNKITYVETGVKGYGDRKSIQQVADMSLISYGYRTVISPYKLAEKIRRAIAGTKHNGKEVCSVMDANFNRVQVFAGEFGGIEFFLQPHIFLFRINYKITTALPECINNQRI